MKAVSPVKMSKAGEPYYQFYLDGKKVIKGIGYKGSLLSRGVKQDESKPVVG